MVHYSLGKVAKPAPTTDGGDRGFYKPLKKAVTDARVGEKLAKIINPRKGQTTVHGLLTAGATSGALLVHRMSLKETGGKSVSELRESIGKADSDMKDIANEEKDKANEEKGNANEEKNKANEEKDKTKEEKDKNQNKNM
ncbi:cyclic nucleotide-gated cation channel beta-3-like [Macrosteles quadrilineatus]|uniref:cyclic nucleotide-gated cation channel beta-3-like n=1 Tax=Macrosteles quadrilineatus TaxID=74068 RepID=UPI0023E1904F|nr:cyclic nucleotide-gated cation channel beta-3-like [Macrosteles quadrilineatus]